MHVTGIIKILKDASKNLKTHPLCLLYQGGNAAKIPLTKGIEGVF